MMRLPVKSFNELQDSDVEARAALRRAARETPVLRAVLRLFAESGGPVTIVEVTQALRGVKPDTVRSTLDRLNEEDLLVLRNEHIDLAYPFSAIRTRFAVRRADGRERFTCCAIDALGIAPMLGEPVEVASFCEHCDAPLTFGVGPYGPSVEARDVMVWVTKSREDEERACTGL